MAFFYKKIPICAREADGWCLRVQSVAVTDVDEVCGILDAQSVLRNHPKGADFFWMGWLLQKLTGVGRLCGSNACFPVVS